MMLDRLLGDCRYYLGYGNRCTSNLWTKDEAKQIKYIKALYNSFNNNKPKFISMEDILQFEKKMCDKEYINTNIKHYKEIESLKDKYLDTYKIENDL